MESWEQKLGRLSPQQRQAVEDFIDFLLQRSDNNTGIQSNAMPPQPVPRAAPPPLNLQVPAPLHTPEPASSPAPVEKKADLMQEIIVGGDDALTGDYIDYGKFEKPAPVVLGKKKVQEKENQRSEREGAKGILDWID